MQLAGSGSAVLTNSKPECEVADSDGGRYTTPSNRATLVASSANLRHVINRVEVEGAELDRRSSSASRSAFLQDPSTACDEQRRQTDWGRACSGFNGSRAPSDVAVVAFARWSITCSNDHRITTFIFSCQSSESLAAREVEHQQLEA